MQFVIFNYRQLKYVIMISKELHSKVTSAQRWQPQSVWGQAE